MFTKRIVNHFCRPSVLSATGLHVCFGTLFVWNTLCLEHSLSGTLLVGMLLVGTAFLLEWSLSCHRKDISPVGVVSVVVWDWNYETAAELQWIWERFAGNGSSETVYRSDCLLEWLSTLFGLRSVSFVKQLPCSYWMVDFLSGNCLPCWSCKDVWPCLWLVVKGVIWDCETMRRRRGFDVGLFSVDYVKLWLYRVAE